MTTPPLPAIGDGRRVLVAGATGYFGKHTVAELARRGFRVRALARNPSRLGLVRPFCDEIVQASAADAASLAGAADGCDVVITSIGTRSAKRRPSFWKVDYGANHNLLELARTAGVERFLFVSVLRGSELRRRIPLAEARERVVDEMRESGLCTTVLRPTGFFNDLAAIFEMARKGTAWVFSGGRARGNPIHGADLASGTVAAIDDETTFDSERNLGGPDLKSVREIAELAFEVVGRPARIRSVPAWTIKTLAAMARPVNANASTMMKFLATVLSEDMIGPTTGTHGLRAFFEQLQSGANGIALEPDVSDLTPR